MDRNVSVANAVRVSKDSESHRAGEREIDVIISYANDAMRDGAINICWAL